MKILTNKTIRAFIEKLSNKAISPHEAASQIEITLSFLTWLKTEKLISENDSVRYSNELYRAKRTFTTPKAHILPFPIKYVGFSLAILSLFLIGTGIYLRFYKNAKTPFAFSSAPVRAGRIISFQGRLTDTLGNPISAPIDITYNFYTAPTGGSPITGSTRVCTASPDQDGVFNSTIGNDTGPSCNTEIPSSIFTENTDVYLGVKIGSEITEMSPRQQIANVGYAINSETLQGMPPGQGVSNVPYINQEGNLLIAASNPGIRSTYASSNFVISSAQATTIQSAGSGDITLSATEGGNLRFNTYNGTLQERMTVLNTGRVGIGITAPRALLDVNGDATVSGSLIAGGQVKIGEFTVPPTNLGNGSLYYDSNTNKVYFWNGSAWTDMGAGATQYFQRTLGSLAPTYITDDLNLGSVATGSALVHLPGTNNQDAWFNLGTGKVGVGDTTPLSLFTVGNGDLFQIDTSGRIIAIDGVSHTIDDIGGNLTLTSNSNTISLNDNVTFAGTTSLNGISYTWPASQTTGYILQTNGSGTLSWSDPTSVVGSFVPWVEGAGVLYPKNSTVDMFIGGQATASAKFAFININSGTPTASISGTISNANIFIDGNGNLSTTNRQSLILGNSATYNSTGNILLNPNGIGNVGIGLTSPSTRLDVSQLAAASTAEEIAHFAMSDDATAYMSIRNGSATDSLFSPQLRFKGSGANTAGNIQGMITTDTGTQPAWVFTSQLASSAIVTRPLMAIRNYTTDVMTILANGNVGISNTNASEKLDVAGNATVSGNITMGGQAQIGRFGVAPTAIGIGSLYYNATDNTPYFYNGSAWEAFLGTSAQFWQRTLGSIAPKNITDDLNLGAVATGSALVHLPGTINQNAWLNLGTGNVGIGITTPTLGKLEVKQTTNDSSGGITVSDNTYTRAGRFWVDAVNTYLYSGGTGATNLVLNDTGKVGVGTAAPGAKLDVNGNLNISSYATISASLALGTSSAAAGPGNLSMSGNLVTLGTVTFSSLPSGIVHSTSGLLSSSALNLASEVTGLLPAVNGGTGADNSTAAQYSVPYYSSTGVLGGVLTPGTIGYVLSTNGVGGAPSWINASGVGTNYWNISNGAIFPNNATLDAFIGGVASASAKFAFLNVNSGTPTASVAGSLANVSTYLTGDGNLATTNMAALTLGGASTGSIQLSPKGTTGLFVDGTGNTGIGTITPSYKLSVSGDINLTGAIRANGNAGANGFLLTSSAGGVNTWTDPASFTGINYWNISNGSIYPVNSTLDAFIGGVASASAKFAFLNSNSGTPTASISGSLANVRTYLTGDGNLATTNMAALTLGGASTGSIQLSPKGTTGLFVDGSGNVGIGTISPTSKLTVQDNTNAESLIRMVNTDSGASAISGILATNGSSYMEMGMFGTGYSAFQSFLPNRGLFYNTGANGMAFINSNTSAPFIIANGTWGGTELLHLTGTGNLGVGTTNPLAKLDVNGTASISGDLSLYGTPSIVTTAMQSLTFGNSNTGNIIMNAGNVGIGNLAPVYKLDLSGDFNLTGAIRANGDPGISGYFLTSSAGGVNTWTNPSTIAGSNYWNISNGAIYPVNSTLDAFIGGVASASAKFAFLNVNSGTPTASVAGSLANVSTYLTGDGNLATTNMAALTLGGASTGSIQLSPKGTTGLNVNGNGDVGIGIVPDSTARLQTYKYNGTNNTSTTGVLSNVLLTQTSSSDFNNTAFQYSLQTAANTGVVNNWSQMGFSGGVQVGAGHLGTFGTVTGINNWNYILSGAAGTVTTMNGIWINQTSTGANTTNITNSRGLYISTPTLNGATLANNYGIYLEDQSGIGGTSNYSIYSAGGTNYFGGSLGLGITPTYKLDVVGDINLTGAIRAGGNAGALGYVLTSGAGGVNTWTDPTALVGGTNLWTMSNGALYPINSTLDAFIGGVASTSAKFAFLNVNSGTPTASISGNLAIASPTGINPATTYDVLNGGTYNLRTSVGGDTGLTSRFYINNIGNVGIGNINPTAKIDITGSASVSGSLTVGNGVINTIQSPFGPLNLAFKSGLDTWSTGLTLQDTTGNVGIGNSNPTQKVTIQQNNYGDLLGIRDGASGSANLLLANAGVLSLKSTAFVKVYACTANANCTAAGADGGTLTDRTTEAANNAGTPYNLLATGTAGNTSFYVGLDHPFNTVNFDIATPDVGTTALTAQFWNGSAWTNVTGQVDNTARFTIDGTITFTLPTTWTTKVLNAQVPLYWLRIVGTTNASTAPTANFSTPTTGNRFMAYGQSGDAVSSLYVGDKGNVGIGTDTPTDGYKLHVNGNIFGDALYDTGNINTFVNPAGDSNFGGSLTIVNDYTGANATMSGNITVGNAGAIRSQYGALNFAYKSGLNAWTTGMVLEDITGNVGIGVTDPTAFLGLAAATTSKASLNLKSSVGVNPATPVSGDMWWNGTNLDFFNGSVTTDILAGATAGLLWTDGSTYVYPTGAKPIGNLASGGPNKISGLYLADSAPITFGNTNDVSFSYATSVLTTTLGNNAWNIANNLLYLNGLNNQIGIGTNSPLATLDLRSLSGTTPVASISGNTSMASLVVDQTGTGDIFTASDSGQTRFVITKNGNVGIGVSNPTSRLSVAGSSSTISNSSGDITFDSASNNISFSNDNLINVGNIASVGQIQFGGFAGAPTAIGNGASYYDTLTNKIFYWDGSAWSEMGSKYWQYTLGSLAPANITDDINIGAIATGSAMVHLPGLTNKSAFFNLGTGSLGVGTTSPNTSYKFHVNGNILADALYDTTSPGSYYVNPAGDSALGGNVTMFGDIFMTDGSPHISSYDGAAYSKIILRGSGDTTNASVCIDEGGTPDSCSGKLDAGTIDPPYTINGQKYATFLPSMTGVKEETTGKVMITEKNDVANAYIRRIELGNQMEGSDLWLFSKVTNLKDQARDLTVLLSSNTNSKVWYTVNPSDLVLTLYSTAPTEVSYRLTAPRFDSYKWQNTREDGDHASGFAINDMGNITGGIAPTYTAPQLTSQGSIFSLIGTFVEEFTAANKALFAQVTTGVLNAQKIVSPLAEIDTLKVNSKISSPVVESELLRASNNVESPKIKTDEILPANNTLSLNLNANPGQLANLVIKGLNNAPVVQIDATGDATFAGTLAAQTLEAQDASISGTLIAKNIQSETIDELSSNVSSISSTLASANSQFATDINTIQEQLATIQSQPLANPAYYQNIDASYDNVTINQTANIYKANIADSLVVGSLFIEPRSILALSSDLRISSLSTITLFDDAVVIAKNGTITTKGEVIATSLAIKNVEGKTVASIDSSGSAKFNEVIANKFTLENIATQGALIADSGILDAQNLPIPAIKTRAEVAGTGVLPIDTKEVIIYNDNVTANSLIYLTPTSENIQGQLSVNKKVSCPQITPTCTPYFSVSINANIHSSTPFNWLIIN